MADAPIFENPAWTNSALYGAWESLERRVGRRMMPVIYKEYANRLIAEEYGSGVYGTVMPTGKKNIVAKVTSDESEAHFAFVATQLKDYPDGLVRYFDVFRLSGTYEDRPIFILWREEAYDVGEAIDEHTRSGQRAAEYLDDIKEYADKAFRLTYSQTRRDRNLDEIIEASERYWRKSGFENHGRGPGLMQRAKLRFFADELTIAGYGVNAARAFADDMAHSGAAELVGAAIRDLIDRGILLADVHPGNVGRVERHGTMRTVITDPGHATFLTREYDHMWPAAVGGEKAHGKASVAARSGVRGPVEKKHAHGRR